jgi:hypothetical protein
MKAIALFSAYTVALCVFCTAAGAMSTVPYSGQRPGTNLAPPLNSLDRREPVFPDNGINPETRWGAFSPYGATRPTGRRPPRATDGFLNIDPFDPNSVVNSYDRNRYANPYRYDPIYNPYGQSGSPYAPTAPNIIPGQGIPYGR